jgi:imidazole glycerol-phosphate synthase subunit HisH
MKIAIVDYGMGNIRSIVSALKYIDVQNIIVSSNNQELKQADKIILPGVGSFGKAMQLIQNKNLDSILNELVVQRQKPVLGICLGMQLLGMFSDEDGFNQGLGFIDGNTDIFDSNNVTVPHVGCNQVIVGNLSRLYQGMGDILDFYFVHSHKMITNSDIGQSMCDYDKGFIASFEKDNIVGTQFHPELSQKNGLNVLRNFVELF